MHLSELCQRELVSIPATASLPEAAALMADAHVGALVVVEPGPQPRAIGIVTDRDLAIRGLALNALQTPARVGGLVTREPVAVAGSATIREAVEVMEQAGVRRLLVLEDGGGVIGILSADDLVGAIARDLDTLARALRVGLANERDAGRPVPAPAPARAQQPRPVFPAFGTAGTRPAGLG